MTTDNILVSREKWEKIVEALKECDEAMGYMSEYDIPLCMPDRVKEALAMPDFIESEKDVEMVERALDIHGKHCTYPRNAMAKSAINALRIKEGGVND